LEAVKRTTESFSDNSSSPGQGLKPEPLEYNAWMLPTRSITLTSINFKFYAICIFLVHKYEYEKEALGLLYENIYVFSTW
jgi:hypothetical protein